MRMSLICMTINLPTKSIYAISYIVVNSSESFPPQDGGENQLNRMNESKLRHCHPMYKITGLCSLRLSVPSDMAKSRIAAAHPSLLFAYTFALICIDTC